MTELSASVRRVVRELRNAPDGGEAWSGDAANAAYDSLGRLAANLDTHAEEIARIESGLTLAGDAVVDARTAYVTAVRSISLDVDEQDFMRTPFMQRTGPVVADLPATLDQRAYDAAVADAKAQREAEALKVLQSFDGSMTEATKKLPVDPDDDPVSGGGTPRWWRHRWRRHRRRLDPVRGRLRPARSVAAAPVARAPGSSPSRRRTEAPTGRGPSRTPTDRADRLPRLGVGATRCSTARAPARPAPVAARCPAARLDGHLGDAGRWRRDRRGSRGRHGRHARRGRGRGAHGPRGVHGGRGSRTTRRRRRHRRLDGRRSGGWRDRCRPHGHRRRGAQGAARCSPGGGQGPAGRASAARGGGGAARAGRYGVPRLGERSRHGCRGRGRRRRWPRVTHRSGGPRPTRTSSTSRPRTRRPGSRAPRTRRRRSGSDPLSRLSPR